MICEQCGAMINDGATVCDNCGFKFEIDEKDMAQELSSPQVPAVREVPEEESFAMKRMHTNLFVKIVAVIGAIVCLGMFWSGALYMDSAIVNVQSQSFMNGFFGNTAGGFPAGFYAGLRQGFIAMGTGLSCTILILGFKKN